MVGFVFDSRPRALTLRRRYLEKWKCTATATLAPLNNHQLWLWLSSSHQGSLIRGVSLRVHSSFNGPTVESV
ncbi:hypothetical protein LshimejAT787_0600790 [Lyophyllum shimeji]|uniref:Uncharacterized protein n=1 Tax=Lyophyllum shimeji TaxID=47721 RepID=A0A9P3PM81_LYOSH|nr:hypothetical protein LshimejAT787_0600790 [Lyophyllum shimeji]